MNHYLGVLIFLRLTERLWEVSQPVLITIYKSLILPHLDYCSVVWGGIGVGLSNKLKKLQNRAARIITGADWDVRSSQILSGLNWTSHADRRIKEIKTLMFKSVNKQLPEYISKRFVNTNTIHRYNLHDSELNIFIPRLNTEALKKSFWYRGAITWNSLPSGAK